MDYIMIIGIDPSINSTGITINDNENFEYFLIVNHLTKKMEAFNDDKIHFILYDKIQPDKNDSFSKSENIKTNNLINISNCIRDILTIYKPDLIIMESCAIHAFNSKSIADLIGLNYIIRLTCNDLNIPIKYITPMQLKKHSVGNGLAKKDVMIKTWLGLQPQINPDLIPHKIDDLADSFFLSIYDGS